MFSLGFSVASRHGWAFQRGLYILSPPSTFYLQPTISGCLIGFFLFPQEYTALPHTLLVIASFHPYLAVTFCILTGTGFVVGFGILLFLFLSSVDATSSSIGAIFASCLGGYVHYLGVFIVCFMLARW